MSNPIDNIPSEKRRGNPSWVEGGPSPNPGGKPKKLREIEAMLDAEFRDVASVREMFTVLRKLALQGFTNDVFDKEGSRVGEKTTYHPAYMEQLFNRLLGPVKDLEIDLSDAPIEALTYLRDKLRQ
jgi:hypothetical protein